jgi:cob(I)alamin adenosyltransferase
MSVSTRTGDGGETGLPGGRRTAKDAPRVAALGEVDELNAALGAVRAGTTDTELRALLLPIQRDLLALGARLADAERSPRGDERTSWDSGRLAGLDRALDQAERHLPPLRAFILPGGVPVAAALHSARAICRRAERSVVALSRREAVDPLALAYLNRLSDLLFVLARTANRNAGVEDEAW